MPRTPLKLLQGSINRNDDISDTYSFTETNSNHRSSRLLDEISDRTTSDTNIEEHNGGDDDRRVTGNIVETCDDNSDDERTSLLHDTFRRLHSQNSESVQVMQMVPLCHNAHRTEKHSRKHEAECLT